MNGLKTPMKVAADSLAASTGSNAIPNTSQGYRAKYVYVAAGSGVPFFKPGDSTTTVTTSIGVPLSINSPLVVDVAGQTHIAVDLNGGTLQITPLENE